MQQRIGLFGGTFNPVHNGHIDMAKYFIQELELDLLLVIPAGYPYHKLDHDKPIDNIHRYHMCQLAFRGIPHTEVSTIDMDKKNNTYTYNTLLNILAIYPKSDFWWLLGSDSFLALDSWYCYQQLIKITSFAIATRSPNTSQDIINKNTNFQPRATIKILNFPPCPINSTEIRLGYKNQIIQSYWLPIEVHTYIKENKLYT